MKKLVNPLPLLKNFIRCGVTGWCMEIFFTALGALRRRELPLIGQTSLWMFPIYGSAALFQPIFSLLKHCHMIVRGTIYAISIFCAEYMSGRFLARHELCPWNYNRHRWHINGLIRIDYFPFWFLAGLLFEHILIDKKTATVSHGKNC